MNQNIPDTFQLCHPDGWSFRYKISGQQKLILEKKVQIIEGAPLENLLMEEDEKYRLEIIEENDFE